MNYFICLCSSLKGLNNCKQVPPFYKTITNDWVKFRQKMLLNSDILLFGNNDLKFRKYPMFYESFTKSGIYKLTDIFNPQEQTFLPDKDILNKLKSKQNWISELYNLKNSIPATWKTII